MNLKFPYGKTPNVLLLGNGINRAYKFMSWDELLQKISTNKGIKLDSVPAPLQAVILTGDNVDVKLKEIAPDLVSLKAPYEEEILLQEISQLPFDAILTTNYTYELEKSICNDFKLAPGKSSKYRKVSVPDSKSFARDNLFTYFELPNFDKPIWHIHGEAAKTKTMILDHYYYGKMLSQSNSYLSALISRYKASQTAGRDFECKSWIDYFLIGNVTIVGLGLDFSEMDLWWLVNAKKRRFPESKIIFYKPDITNEQMMLAEAYGVNVVKEDNFDKNYIGYYQKLMER